MSRVAITGIGIYTSLGENKLEVLKSLKQNHSKIVYDKDREDFGVYPYIGVVKPPRDIPRHLSRIMTSKAQYAYKAVQEALSDSKLEEDCGIIVGEDSPIGDIIKTWEAFREKKNLDSTYFYKTLGSGTSAILSNIFHKTRLGFSLSSTCSSGLMAVGMGYKCIRADLENSFICGGCSSIDPYSYVTMSSLNVNSKVGRCTPLSDERDGTVPSGGAAFVTLEKNKEGYAEILEFNSLVTSPVYPNVDSIRNLLQMFSDYKIDYVIPHATGTKEGDKVEMEVVADLFPKSNILTYKQLSGHGLRISGIADMIYGILQLKDMGNASVLVNSFGIDGHLCAMLIKL